MKILNSFMLFAGVLIALGSFTTGSVNASEGADAESAESLWLTDADAALKKAKAEGRTLIMNFTGSDWCVWCKRLDREVFSTPEFRDYAARSLVLLKLDFPNRSDQPDWEKEQNQEQAEAYGIRGFPTIVVLDSGGTEVGRLGYARGGPKAWLAQLESLTKEG